LYCDVSNDLSRRTHEQLHLSRALVCSFYVALERSREWTAERWTGQWDPIFLPFFPGCFTLKNKPFSFLCVNTMRQDCLAI